MVETAKKLPVDAMILTSSSIPPDSVFNSFGFILAAITKPFIDIPDVNYIYHIDSYTHPEEGNTQPLPIVQSLHKPLCHF